MLKFNQKGSIIMDEKEIVFEKVKKFTIPEDLKIARAKARKCFESGLIPTYDGYPNTVKDIAEIDDQA